MEGFGPAGGVNLQQWAVSIDEKDKTSRLVMKILEIQRGRGGGFEEDRGFGNEEEQT